MRKASQDGGDSTSITSGLDNELKKPGAGILKTKKTSIKRKVQNFSLESDDGVVEPLLQKEKEKMETGSHSAKFSLSKIKTDSMSDKSEEKDKLLDDNKTIVPSMTSVHGVTNSRMYANGIKDSQITKSYASAAPIHNHMNTNVFASHAEVNNFAAPKTQVLVEIDGNKQKTYSPSPLIFTTAKIHTDGKTKQLEPVHVTSHPIISTAEETDDRNELRSAKKDFLLGNVSKSEARNQSESCEDYVTSSNTVATVSVSFYSGILNKGPTVTTASTICTPFVVTELKTFKYIPSEGKIQYFTKAKDNTEIKEKEINRTSLPQTTQTVVSESGKKSTASKDLKSPSTVATATRASISKTGVIDMSGKMPPQHASAPVVASEVEMDINKNVQSVNVSTPQRPESSYSPSIVGEITKDNLFSTKQLQRQKKATTEEDQTSNLSTREATTHSADKSSNVKSSMGTTQDCVDSIRKDISPKTCSNNSNVSNTIFTTSPIVTKDSGENSVPISKMPKFDPKCTIDKTTETVSIPLTTGATKPLVAASTKTTSPSLGTVVDENKVKMTGNSRIPTSTIVTNVKTSPSITTPNGSTEIKNIPKTSSTVNLKSKEALSTSALNGTKTQTTPAIKTPTAVSSTVQAVSNIPPTTTVASNNSKTQTTSVSKSTVVPTLSQSESTKTTPSSALNTTISSSVKTAPTSITAKTGLRLPITTPTTPATLPTCTTSTTKSATILSSSSLNKPKANVVTTLVSKTPTISTTTISTTKSSDTLALSQSVPSVKTGLKSITPESSSIDATTSTAAISIPSKPTTVTTMRASTTKVSQIPKTTTKSVTPTTESAIASTAKSSVNIPIKGEPKSSDQSKNDKSKA